MRDVTERMEKLGWYKETHLILGKKRVRFHKEGFELPYEEAQALLYSVPFDPIVIDASILDEYAD